MHPLLKLDDIKCHFPSKSGLVRAVDGVSLEVTAGETFALVGESGCGKSTLAKTILGLAPKTAGQIEFAGKPLIFDKSFRQRAQVVFQDPYSSLNPRLKVSVILSEPLWANKTAHGLNRQQIKRRVAEVLELVGLPPTAGSLYPHEFSGGQRQRIAIARALILDPELIILDEPISALDVSIRAQILNLLQDIQDELNITYLLIAHDLALVQHASDRVAVMYLGRIVETGPTEEIFANPRHPYTQALLSAVPAPDPTVIRNSSLIQGDVGSALSPPTGCHFHPRCPHKLAKCDQEQPHYVKQGQANLSCWLYD
ncbi:MAG: ATP-binding cassette domain-containing protein [Pseudomonadales bacterium]|nr:ATP-binding cassette domain-containing protein [Pseudomonadales bacterium]